MGRGSGKRPHDGGGRSGGGGGGRGGGRGSGPGAPGGSAGGGAGGGRPNKKAMYYKQAKQQGSVPYHARGFLVTTGVGFEVNCAREMQGVLSDYLERAAEQESAAAGAAGGAGVGAGPGSGGQLSIDQLLAAEVSGLRDVTKAALRRYETGVKGVVFLALQKPKPKLDAAAAGAGKAGAGAGGGGDEEDDDEEEDDGEEDAGEDKEEGAEGAAGAADEPSAAAGSGSVPAPAYGPNPRDVVLALMRDAAKDHTARGRHCQRLLPVEATCYAKAADIVAAVTPLLASALPPLPAAAAGAAAPAGARTFAVVMEARAANGLPFEKMALIKQIADAVPAGHKVDLTAPDFTIVVQILKNVALIGVAPDYNALCRYNLRMLGTPPEVLEAERAAARDANERQMAAKAAKATADAAAAPAAAAGGSS